jgi:aryl-alcohol dehydrogenase-like predicted oxidoreductase
MTCTLLCSSITKLNRLEENVAAVDVELTADDLRET